ncbi:DUF4232 domain-containing protein [Streptomyces sp. I05A-00742]|uniref:DUF4232 domain-containing protein n=1 Tax=Streptomyces sp. I05A-00742 TaxID=2732853 RepID=UPI001488FC10|nr:DUF4232 domain-containing protein [Streptomyces sp. I05A-00742]
MRKNLVRTTALAAMALTGVLSLSACNEDGVEASAPSTPSASRPAPQGQAKETGGGDAGDGAKASAPPRTKTPAKPGGGKPTGGTASRDSGEAGDKSRYGQACGTNDLSWTAKSKTQAGGYILISVKAKPGITCTLPGVHPVVAFGSDGTEARPAQHSVGEPVKLTGATTAYAGVNPKTTNTDYGKELNEIIVTVGQDDGTDPISLPTGSITVDKPVVTNWHTSPQDAVPGDGVNGN